MGIKAGTTITVTFDARQIAQLDCLLQNIERIGICFLPPGTISSAWTRER